MGVLKTIADHRIPVSEKIHSDLFYLKKAGQTFDELLAEMIVLKQEHDFKKHIAEIEETSEFMTLEQAAGELHV